MDELFVAILSMLLVAALIPLYLWKRHHDSQSSSSSHDEPRQAPVRETVVRATATRRMRRRPAASGASSSSAPPATQQDSADESDNEAAGEEYEAKASKKKEIKRQEREARRQAEEATRESRQSKQDRYSEMRRLKDEEREAQERKLEEEAKAQKAKEEEAAALEFEQWKGEFSVDDEGTLEEEQDKTEDLLTNFVEYIKKYKCVPLEDLAAEFKLRTQECINRIASLESMGQRMFVCCKKDPKFKTKLAKKTKFLPRRYGDLTIAYDVLQSFKTSYFVQITIDNNHPLGRLDHWNLTWEWQKGEFINTLKGAYARIKDPSECLYGPAGKYYGDLDFSAVANCQKKPILSDLPSEKKEDEKVGKLPWCCRNGTVLPPVMDKNKARSIFQMQVFKIPPDDNRTAITPPMKWHIDGVINPKYTCGPAIRVDPQQFPDPTGLNAISTAFASWQIVCNMTKPKPKENRCCVSWSAFYNESAIPCNTCACGCDDTRKCNANAQPLLLPPDALLVPFVNRTLKARAWAKLKHMRVPNKLPCGDNCPVSINWHVSSDHKEGWTARITIFNWEDFSFDDWFTALKFDRHFEDFQDVYSFNGTRIPGIKTIFLQGLKDLNYLAGETNGSHIGDPRVPGKQQSVISFHKRHAKDFNVVRDAFPSKVYFNGMECALPPHRPAKSLGHKSSISVVAVIFTAFMTFLIMTDRFF